MAVAGTRSSKRSNKSRRTARQRGGGTSYWSFAPTSADATMNNPMAWKSSDSAAGTDRLNPTTGPGLPGMSSMSSLQRGGGGGTHYGFTGVMVDTPAGLVADGTIGGMRSIPTNCALPAQQLNVRGGELWTQAGGASPSAMVPAGPSPASMNIAAPVAAMVAETKGGKRSKSKSKSKKSKSKKSKSKKSTSKSKSKSKSKKSKSKSRR